MESMKKGIAIKPPLLLIFYNIYEAFELVFIPKIFATVSIEVFI